MKRNALETRHCGIELLLILRRIVTPEFLDVYPGGTLPAPQHSPAVDRLLGESCEYFSERLSGMIADLPAGTVVEVIGHVAQ